MAATLIFLILSIFSTVEAQQRHTNISTSSSLSPITNSSWLSRSGVYAFGFYPRGSNTFAVGVFLAGIPEKTVVWTANRDDPPVSSNATITFSDQRLILQQPQGEENTVNTTSIADTIQPISAASMLDTGNFVLYNSDGEIIWQSFDSPTDTILPSQRLLAGMELVSSSSKTDDSRGIFHVKMRLDGRLVQFPTGTPDTNQYLISSGTMPAGDNVTLNLDDNGRLYLLNSTGTNIQNLFEGESASDGNIYRVKIDVDGIFRLYSRTLDPKHSWSILWHSSEDPCDANGICGLNAYCVQNDTEASCICLPGFDFVNPGKWASGCERNFVVDSCQDTDGRVNYTMSKLDYSFCEEAPYSIELSTREECEASCLQDCNCEVALYRGVQCKKQRLPMRYGRRALDVFQIAFIKVGTSTPIMKAEPVVPTKETKKEVGVEILIISVSLIAFAFVVFAISGVLTYRNRFWAYKTISRQENVELGEEVAPRTFTLAELDQVTNGFDEELGNGAFGTVYKGIIPYNQKVVAVKKLEKGLTEGEKEFQTEVKVIGKTHHRNLVRLIGYCLDGPNRLLVYDYMKNGSLADYLFTPENQPGWDIRIGIALDIARGILYLHEECEMQIIHCDIKSKNILMDEHGCAKISDFGLAKLLKPDQTKTFTAIRGTKGYVAPEWHRKLPITVKTDVYSFGVVLLEIICGRKCLEWSRSEDEAVLEEWVYDCFEAKELGKLVGDEEVDMRKLERMVKVGLWCIQYEPSLRPSMKKVLLMLEGTVDIPVPPSPTSFLSAI